jgi:alkanesulfonate monooxygenase
MARRKMKLGVSMRILGYHSAAWRHPDVAPGAGMTMKHFIDMTQLAERGKFDMVFLADGNGVRVPRTPPGVFPRTQNPVGFEPITLLSALAMVSENIGLVATASTTFNDPFNLARKFASLDHISGGRAAWNAVTSTSIHEALNFSLDAHPPSDERYDRAAEFVDVVCGLWDSWDADAFIEDKASGLIFDEAKMHVLDHRGKYFSVRGPLNVPRSPQGSPVVIQAGASDKGRELAAATANAIYAASQTLEQAQDYYASVKGRMAKYGRAPDELKIMPGVMPIVGQTRAEAAEKFALLQDLLDPLVGLSMLADGWGDLSGHDLDGPVPPLVNITSSRSKMYADLAARENLTIRQLYRAAAAGRGHRTLIGTPSDIADQLADWMDHDAADGFNILPSYSPGGFAEFVDMVVPELQRRGLFRTEYEGRTLRENLGVPVPRSRFSPTLHKEAGN